MEPLELVPPYSGGHLTLETDICNVQNGCVLLQNQPDKETKSIGCWSRSLTDTKQRYNTVQRKYLAAVWSVLHHLYLEESRFTVGTDHETLNWMLNPTDSTGGLGRWQLRLSEFNSHVVHRAGVGLPTYCRDDT